MSLKLNSQKLFLLLLICFIPILPSHYSNVRSEENLVRLNYLEYYSYESDFIMETDCYINWSFIILSDRGTINVLAMVEEERLEWVPWTEEAGTVLSINDDRNSGIFYVDEEDKWYVIFLHHDEGEGEITVVTRVEFVDPIDGEGLFIALITTGSVIAFLILFSILITTITSRRKKQTEEIAKLSEFDREDIIRRVSQSYNRMPLEMLTRLLKFNSQSELETWRLNLPNNLRFYIDSSEAVFVNQALTLNQESSDIISQLPPKDLKKYTCHYCYTSIDADMSNCPNCSKEIPRCVICKLPITHEEKIGSCKLCNSIAHLEHITQWIEISGKCPHCLQEIPMDDIQQII